MIRLTVNDLRLVKDGLIYLDDIQLEARPGTIHLVVGPEGSGKSLLAHTIVGLEPDADGEIYLDGRDMIAIPPDRRRMAWVGQENGLWAGYSVFANVEFGLKSRKIPRQERKARASEALGLFGADSLRDRRVESLNPLEARRVAMARSIAVDPQILILDEPTAGLEPQQADLFIENILRVQADQRLTTVLLSRQPAPWWSWSDRISLLDQGRIIQSGSSSIVFDRPMSHAAAEMLGPCNILSGEVEAADPKGEILVRLPFGRLLGILSGSALTVNSGDKVSVYIRPESVNISPASTSGQVNRIPVRIESIVSEGGLRRLKLLTQGDLVIEAVTTSGAIQGIQPGATTIALVAAEQIGVVVDQ